MGIITYFDLIQSLLGFPGGAVVKNPPSHAGDVEDWVRSLGLEDLLAEGMATHSNILAWKIPWTEESGGLQSMGSLSRTQLKRLHFHLLLSCIGEGNGNPLHCSCLENPRDGVSLVSCRVWGRTESDTTEVT